MSGLSRRQVLVAAASGVAATACSLAAAASASSTLADALAGLVVDAGAAARLGRRLLEAEPGRPRDRAALGRAILSDSDDRHAFLNAAPRERKRLLRNRIAADFAAGRTVVVDGWVLAEAEALLAALVACYS